MKKIFSFIIAFFALVLLMNVSALYGQCDKDVHKTCKQGIAIVRSDDGNPTPLLQPGNCRTLLEGQRECVIIFVKICNILKL
jgi:hypothetical protein